MAKHLNYCLFSEPQGNVVFEEDGFQRSEICLPMGCSKIIDHHLSSGMQVHFLQVTAGNEHENIMFEGEGEVFHFLHSNEMGLLIRIKEQGQECTVWFPPHAGEFVFDEEKRISSERSVVLHLECSPGIRLSVQRPKFRDCIAVIPYVVMKDSTGEIFHELANYEEIERRLYLKSEWFSANSPADVWKYLINGSVYDPRSFLNVGKRFRCQQCANAWWTYFQFLHIKTGKKIYNFLQDQIAWSIAMEISPSGEWKHGFWSDDMETHSRFHVDGLHLFLSQYEKTENTFWLERAEWGMSYLITHLMDELDDGSIWFLHDTLELCSPKHIFQSSLYGKHRGNSLTINTHLCALMVLHRLRQAMPHKKYYAVMYEKGVRTLPRILGNTSGELLYKVFMSWVIKNVTWVDCQSYLERICRGLEGRAINVIYRILRWQFPRIMQPGGFMERDLTLSCYCHSYQSVNLKDLLSLYQQDPFPWLCPAIEDGINHLSRFIQKVEVKNALTMNSLYNETIDVLYLFERVYGRKAPLDIDALEKQVFQATGGYSLDYYVLTVVNALNSSKQNLTSPKEQIGVMVSKVRIS